MQKKYEVIRLIKQNAGCHIVMDYVEGEILVFYLKNHPDIEKEQLFIWIKQIIRQLDDIQRVKGIGAYGYVTPYCMVVKEDKSIALLDLNAESNFSVLKNMEKQSILDTFFSSDESEDDFYPLGKTIQFLFAHVEIEPALTKKEEQKFQKIISKCLSKHKRKSYQRISDILTEFPKINEKRKYRKKNIRMLIFIILMFMMCVVYFGLCRDRDTKHSSNKKVQETSIDNSVLFDIGLTYFTDLEDYQKSREFFDKSKKGCEFGEEYATLAEFMCGGDQKNVKEIEEILLKIQDYIIEEKDSRYYKSLLKVYMRLDTEQAQQKIKELGEKILLEKDWKAEEEELRKLLALAYTKSAEYEKAIEEYEILCEWNKSEMIYKALIELYEKTNQEEKVLEMCQIALEEFPDSEDMNVIYLRTLCVNAKVPKEVAEQYMEEMINRFPDLLNNQEFQKLQMEYGIKIEGGNVWIEK